MSANRVLIIDDDKRICRIIKRVADDLGNDSLAIDNPKLFESSYLDYEPNVILMDLRMPRLDGIELLRKLSTQQSKAAIILVSGMDKNVLETARDFGKTLGLNMVGILSKPIDIDDVKNILDKHFNPLQEQHPQSLNLTEEELKKAIDQNELVVYYQPQIQLKSGRLIGAEALVRWQHPEHGLVFPDSFIPLAESNKELIGSLTYTVLETALQDDKVLREQGIELNISVNLSAKLLSDLAGC